MDNIDEVVNRPTENAKDEMDEAKIFGDNSYGVLEKLILSVKNSSNSLSNDHFLNVAFSSIFTKVSNHRHSIIEAVDKIKKFYLADVILSQMADDALSPDTSTGDVLSVYSDNEKIQPEIERLQERINFDAIAMDIVEDLLAYGEYTLRVITKDTVCDSSAFVDEEDKDLPDGLIELADTIDQTTVVPITRHGEVVNYLVQTSGGKIVLEDADKYVSFVLGRRKVRVRLDEEFALKTKECEKLIGSLPRFVRVGRSVLYPIIEKIKELELLEQLVPASKLSKMLSGTVVGVQMSSGTEINKAIDACVQIENVLNKKVAVDSRNKELTIESITASAGKFKVIPLFGEKGGLQNLDYDSGEPEDLLSSTNEIREIVCDSIGVPYELIFGSDGESKGETLKRYARYLRKLKTIQKAISQGVRQAVCIHLVKSGFSFSEDDVKVEFRNKLVEIDNLDKLEFLDTTVGFLSNINSFVSSLVEEDSIIKDKVNTDVYSEFIGEQLETIGLGGLVSEEEAPSAPVVTPQQEPEIDLQDEEE